MTVTTTRKYIFIHTEGSEVLSGGHFAPEGSRLGDQDGAGSWQAQGSTAKSPNSLHRLCPLPPSFSIFWLRRTA